jgi:uncharacterized repeat protein (TIGR03803 family)
VAKRKVVYFFLTSMTIAALAFAPAIARAQTETVVYSFRGNAFGSEPAGSLTGDSKGNAYGTASTGGNSNCPAGCGLIFKGGPFGFAIVYSFTGGPNDGANPRGTLLLDKSSGNLYGTTAEGGTNGNGTVFQITPSGTETVLWSFGASGSGDGTGPNGSLAMDAQGNLYGTTHSGGAFNSGTVFEITASGAESVLYSFQNGADGAAPIGGPVLDKAGNIYGTTSSGGGGFGTVFKLSPSGEETILHKFRRSVTDGEQPASSLVFGPRGDLFGTTEFGGAKGNGTVFVINPATGYEKLLYSFGSQISDGIWPFAGVTLDSNGNIYGTTLAGGVDGVGTVYSLTQSGTESVVHTFGEGRTDGVNPYGGLLLDSQGNLYGTTFVGGIHGEGAIYEITP